MTRRVVTIGEAMVEFSPNGDGLWQQGFAGDTLNVAWAMRAHLPPKYRVSFFSRVGQDKFSSNFRQFLKSAGIEDGGVSQDDMRTMGLYASTIQDQRAKAAVVTLRRFM